MAGFLLPSTVPCLSKTANNKVGVSLFSSRMAVSRFLFASVFSGKIRGAYR